MADCTRRRGAARRGAAAVRRANGERAWVRCTRKVHPDARDVRRACSAGYARGVEAPRAGCSPPAAGPEPVQRQGGARSGQLRIGAKERRAGRSGPKRKVRPSGRRTRAASVARAMTSSERWAMSWNCCAEGCASGCRPDPNRGASGRRGGRRCGGRGGRASRSSSTRQRVPEAAGRLCFSVVYASHGRSGGKDMLFLRNGAPGGPFSAAGAHFLPNQAFRKGKDSGVGSGSQSPLFGIFRRGRRAGRRDSRAG